MRGMEEMMETENLAPTAQSDTTPWGQVVSSGLSTAVSRLSKMMDQPILITSIEVGSIPNEIIVDELGGAEAHAVAIYLEIKGDARSHMTVVVDEVVASQFLALLLGREVDGIASLSTMEISALEEVGNILGSFFFNTVADATDLYLRCAPPTVIVQKTLKTLDHVIDDPLRLESDAFVTKARFEGPDCDITGVFFVVPGRDLVDAVFGGARMSDFAPRA